MKKYNFILVAVMLFLIVGIFYFTKDMPREMHGIVGPGQWPRFIAVVMSIFTGILLFQTISMKKSDTPSPIDFKSKGFKKVFIIFLVLIAFSLALTTLGFLISSSLFIIAVMLVMGERNILRILLSSIGFTIIIYIFFGLLLNVMLPRPFFM